MLIAAPAHEGLWLDTAWPLTEHVLDAIVSQSVAHYCGVFRYLPLPGNASAGDLSAQELMWATSRGLQVGAVQHVRGSKSNPFWDPTAHSGREDGLAAVAHARAAGLPPGTHLFQDLEAVNAVAGAREVTRQYCEDWGMPVIEAGYQAGIYVGFAAQLQPADLWLLSTVNCYWSDPGPRSVSIRGCAIKQQARTVTIAGVTFDVDAIAKDNLKGLPYVATATAAA
jgi:hypothetical protein